MRARSELTQIAEKAILGGVTATNKETALPFGNGGLTRIVD
jgi:hypothetical protein